MVVFFFLPFKVAKPTLASFTEKNMQSQLQVVVSWAESGFYTLEKMRFPKKGQTDTILDNSHITLTHIPAQAYKYVVKSKGTIE